MADVGMVLRISANIDQLRQRLKEGGDLIHVTTAGMDKLANSLNGEKLSQRAHNIVAAVDKIGGATKLTTAEKARLNTTLQAAVEKYTALGRTAPKAMVDLEQATRRVEAPTNAVTTKMIALGSAAGAFLGNIAVSAVKQFGQSMLTAASNGVQLASLVMSFDRLAGSIGETGDTMLSVTRSATKGLISDLGIMQTANKAMLLGLPVTSQEMGKLAQTAVVLGKAMGQGATKSLDDLITALGRSSPMILDNLGLTVKVGEANEKYAASLGKSASQLSEAEKKTAFYRAAMEAAEAKTATLGGVHLTLSDQLGRVATGVGNIVTNWGRQLAQAPAVNGFVEGLADRVTRLAQRQLDEAEAMKRLTKEYEEQRKAGERLLPVYIALEKHIEQIQVERIRDTIRGNRPGLPSTTPLVPLPFDDAYLDFIENKLTKAPAAAVKAAEQASEKTKRLIVDMREFGEQQFRSLMGMAQVVSGGLPKALQQENALGLVSPGFLFGPGAGLSQITPGGQLPASLQRENMMGPLAPGGKGASLAGFIGANLGPTIMSAFTGGGSIGKSIGGLLGGGIGTALSGTIGKVLSGTLGKTIGSALGSAIPGIGAAVGPLIGSLFGKLFGSSQAKQTADMRKQWLEQAGGVEKFREAAERAGVSVDKIFGAKKPKDFEAAVKAATTAINEAEERQKRLNDVVQRYGLTIDQLGPKFRNQKLDDQAQALLEDFRDLLDVTENVGLATEKIAPHINDYLRIAIRTGAEVPAALRPIIERMQEMGLLADDNAERLGDITWAETMSAGFDRVVEAVNRLTAALTGAAAAADSIQIPDAPGGGAGGGPGGGSQPPELHEGGRILPFRRAHDGWRYPGDLSPDEVPIIAQTGEGILSRRGMAAFDAMNQGQVPASDMRGVERRLDALSQQLARQADLIPIAARDAALLSRAR